MGERRKDFADWLDRQINERYESAAVELEPGIPRFGPSHFAREVNHANSTVHHLFELLAVMRCVIDDDDFDVPRSLVRANTAYQTVDVFGESLVEHVEREIARGRFV